MLKKTNIMLVALALFTGLLNWSADPAFAFGSKSRFSARLNGFQEVPSVSTEGRGRFTAKLSEDGNSLEYELSYENLSDSVRFAHIHFGARHTNGGVIVFLCDSPNFPDPTGSAPECPSEGTVAGTLTANNVIGPEDQGINSGEFDKLIDALRALAGYVNVHTVAFGGGEIRGQIYRY